MVEHVSFDELEHYFVDVLRAYLGILDTNNGDPLSFSGPEENRNSIQIVGIEGRVARKAFGLDGRLDQNGRTHVRKLIWRFIVQGYLVPGTDTEPALPWLTITPEGERWLTEETDLDRRIFTSSDAYLSRLSNQGIALGDISKSYIVEAINSYFNNCPRASMVMVGVSLEALFDELDNAFSTTNHPDWQAVNLEDRRRPYSRRLNKFQRVIASRYREITGITGVENPQLFLDPMLDHIRQTRNDGAHAELPNHDHNEAFAMLELFSRVAKIMCLMRDHLNNYSS